MAFAASCFAQTSAVHPPASAAKPVSSTTNQDKAVAAKPAATTEVPFFSSRVLSNGLEVIVFEDHTVPLVSVEYSVKAGAYVETPAQSGLSHLYEHMYFKSNRAMKNQEDYVKNIGQLGITYNGTTAEESCSEFFTGLSSYLTTMVHVTRDFARYPVFDANDLSQEEQVVIGEMDRLESNPYSVIQNEINKHLYYKYPNRKFPIGSRDVVGHTTLDQMREFQARYWVPNNSALLITGDVKPEDAFKQVEQFFGDWPRAADPFVQNPMVQHPALTKSEGLVLEAPVTNVVIDFGWQGPSVGQDSASTYAADVFSFILAQPNSRFQRNLSDTGLATEVGVGYFTQRSVGPINLILQTTSDKARAALQAAQNEVAHFGDADYFTDQELQNAKVLLAADDLRSREKPSEYIHTLGFWWAIAGTDYLKSYQQQLNAVSRADIRKYLQTYIMNKPRVAAILLSSEAQKQIHMKSEEVAGQ
jgi:zinc protease